MQDPTLEGKLKVEGLKNAASKHICLLIHTYEKWMSVRSDRRSGESECDLFPITPFSLFRHRPSYLENPLKPVLHGAPALQTPQSR